jgi:membrane protein YdbS with pleckstrin-like domain
MHCRACGVEVVEQAVYCHKCGDRLDLQQQSPPGERAETTAVPGPSGPAADEHVSVRPAHGAEKLQPTAAAHQAEGEEPEKELWQGGYGSRAMIGAWAMTGLVTLLLLAIWIWQVRDSRLWIALVIVILLIWLYQLLVLARRRLSVSYQLTTQRLIHVSGILRRVTDRLQVIEIDDITVEQGLLERLVGVGSIRIASADRTHPVLLLRGIENVNEVSALMDEVRRTERLRRGMFIEQI